MPFSELPPSRYAADICWKIEVALRLDGCFHGLDCTVQFVARGVDWSKAKSDRSWGSEIGNDRESLDEILGDLPRVRVPLRHMRTTHGSVQR